MLGKKHSLETRHKMSESSKTPYNFIDGGYKNKINESRCKICGVYLNSLAGQNFGRDVCEDCRVEICKHYNPDGFGVIPSFFPIPGEGAGDPVPQPDYYVGDPIPPFGNGTGDIPPIVCSSNPNTCECLGHCNAREEESHEKERE